ncbi:hypothetical protein [Pleionea sp. CnH1-48]|uniref:hypothetical protein n=1 Tax=Pleionea sp. CnH1-48 TaxID=2954494 RepID=UPI0020976753|nr:hypothetical protein [Pleionea sp. CnH1-48]MCO7224747.1 hypothetical protein [Pleionea sp. CnH1-48]
MKNKEVIDGLDFEGKVVSFGTESENLAIKNISFEKQFGRIFVVGEVPAGATNNDWAAGRPCAIAWDLIQDYMVFDSEDQYSEALEKS